MDDQGQYIVEMAHELLRTDFASLPNAHPVQNAPLHRRTVSLKILCLATLLAAASSGAVTAWATAAKRPLTHYQKTELNALVFYAARLRNVNEALLRNDIELQFGVDSIDDLTGYDYIFARRYLQDLAQ